MPHQTESFLLDDHSLNLPLLQRLQQKPAPFTPGKPRFWDDPHISRHLLAAHLDPATEAASRPPEMIERSVAWITETLHLKPGDTVLDLGCGPGLYAVRFAQRGLIVTGVDYSRRSIDYATQYSREHQLPITYRYQDYLTLKEIDQYNVALLIYGDFCPLAPEQRLQLLHNVHRALKSGGYFVLDVSTRALRKQHGLRNGWYAKEEGFWKPGPHLVLEQGFDYPDLAIYLDQYIVIEADGTVSIYRNWFQDYHPESITAEIEAGGFHVQSLGGDLAGTPYTENAEWIGVVAQK